MGTALLKIKLMPGSPESDLDKIQQDAKKILDENNAKGQNFEIEPIAFGLKALIVGFGIDESQELEPIENALREIDDVNSAEVIDMRRALE
jgi:elongation factor 1-beta